MTDPSRARRHRRLRAVPPDEQKRELLETPDVAERLASADRRGPATTSPRPRSPTRSATTSARAWRRRSASSCCASSSPRSARSSARASPTGADDYRARVEAADLPEKVREAALREVDKLERASDQSPEAGWIRTWLDTVLELPWNVTTEDSTDVDGAREVLDADHHGLDDVKDRIVEYLAVRARRAERGLQVVGGRGSGAVLAAGRPARRRQDLARGVRRPRAGPQVRPRRPRRRPRRGRDPRPPAHLRRRAARPHRPRHQGGRLDEPGRAARRGRQGRRRLPRRPGRGAARGARPGAEPHVPRPLPRGRPRPVRRAVPRHRQRGRARSRRRCWTGWSWSRSTATPRTRRSPSPATSCCPGSWSGRR